jgi:hypothetical protein
MGHDYRVFFKAQGGGSSHRRSLRRSLWMESDCVSLQNSLLSSDGSVSSPLTTPDLTPPSSCGSENSYFSVLSCHSSHFSHPLKGPYELDPCISEMACLKHVEFPSKIPIPLPPPTRRHPRKLRKSRPCVPRLTLDLSIPDSSKAASSAPQRLDRRLFLWSLVPRRPSAPEPKFLKRDRRSSLPTIPTSAVYLPDNQLGGELDKESCENLQAVRVVTPKGVGFIVIWFAQWY